MNLQKYASLRNNTYSILSLSFLFFVICFISNQHSYSQLSPDNNNIDIFLDVLIEKGDELSNENRNDEAIGYYDRALSLVPEDTETLFKKGNALYGLGNYNEAIQYYDKVLEIDPNYIDALKGKAFALEFLGNYNEAMRYYDKVLEHNPIDLDTLSIKGFALLILGKYDEAIEYYDKVLAINSTDIDVLLNKGVALLNLGKYDEAIEYYDKVLEIDPNNTDALNSKNDAVNNALNELGDNIDSNDVEVNPSNIENNYEYTQEEGWMNICIMVQSALYQSCDVYVNDNGILTVEGERAFGCIRNGALLGGGALTLGLLPPALITKGLEMLSTPTGCDGIVNFQALNALGNLGTILEFLN